MAICKYCGLCNVVMNGIVLGKQRYKCKDCYRSFREGDKRQKYDFSKQLKVLKWYLEGAGIRSISRMEEVSPPVIIDWIRNYSSIIKDKLSSVELPAEAKNIQIIELDELFSYCKKKVNPSMYGLLWTESGIKLLISK